MAFRNFIVSDGAKEASFIPREPREFSYGMGSPSTSVNNNDVDAVMLEPTIVTEEVISLNIGEVSLAIKALPDVEILSSDDVSKTYAGTSGIAGRVRERKGTEMKTSKPPTKRELDIPTLLSRASKKKKLQEKVVGTIPSEGSYDEDIHGKSLLCSHKIIRKFHTVLNLTMCRVTEY
jgi:hypothetical protein